MVIKDLIDIFLDCKEFRRIHNVRSLAIFFLEILVTPHQGWKISFQIILIWPIMEVNYKYYITQPQKRDQKYICKRAVNEVLLLM